MARNTVTVKLEGGDELMAALQRLGVNVREALEEATLDAAREIQERANALAPGPHIEVALVETKSGDVTAAVGPDKEHWYYRFAEYGAQPHEITGSPLLAFEGDQGAVIASSVDHPGQAAKPFLRPARDEGAEDAKNAMAARLRKAIEK